MNPIFESLAKASQIISDLDHKFECYAIHFRRPILTATGETYKLEKGHLVRVENGVIADVTKQNKITHIVMKVYSTAGNKLFAEVKDLVTEEILIINI